MIISSLNNLNVEIELLTPQVHENMAIIPLKTEKNTKKKGGRLVKKRWRVYYYTGTMS